ncbi:PTS transporter subunit EIIC [Streptomyces sp. AJS327]|uniref:PTS transporter subunit EIIC n=1 Tax=Streptomyces sp. AJS327 TaxID=2545265 RepID=UPI0015DFA8F9|nr:PTS transporter subunit EIIC [Streptomyces sp. AJS327]
MSDQQHREIAAAILPLVGGAGNVTSVAQCMTRLRLTLVHRSLVQDEALTALPAVLGVVEDDTYQIVLGPGKVARIAPAFEALLHEERAASTGPTTPASAPPGGADHPRHPHPANPAAPHGQPPHDTAHGGGTPPDGATPNRTTRGAADADGPAPTAESLAAEGAALRAERKRRNATPVKLLLRRIANIFVPLIPALIGAGIVAGLSGVLGNAGWLPGLTPALNAISAGFMSLIAVFVGINTAREFGGTPVLGGAAASVIVFAGVSEVSVLGERLSPGQGGVLGALGAALLATFLERGCRRVVPEAVDVLVTPTVTLLVTGLVTLFGLMFLAGEVATGIGRLADWLLAHGGAVAGLVLGGLFLPLVMLGLHQALIPIHTTLIEQDGFTVLLPILAMAGAGQVGAAIAVYLRLRENASIRRTIRSALPAGFLGVGEPLIYGVSLPLGRPFVTACLGGAVGGGVIGLCYQLGGAVGSTAIGPSGWALFPLLKGDTGLGTSAAVYGAGLLAGYLAGFGLTYCFGFTRQMLTELNATTESTAVAPHSTPAAPDPAPAPPSAPAPAPAATGGPAPATPVPAEATGRPPRTGAAASGPARGGPDPSGMAHGGPDPAAILHPEAPTARPRHTGPGSPVAAHPPHDPNTPEGHDEPDDPDGAGGPDGTGGPDDPDGPDTAGGPRPRTPAGV